jgi:hypothetical protein
MIRRLRRCLLLATAVAAVAATVAAAGWPAAQAKTHTQAAADSRVAADPRAVSPGVHTVTLITGDRVTTGAGLTGVVPAAGRHGITFAVSTSTVDGHVRVVPSDAVARLASGNLDPRLFDVSALIAAGYDRAGPLPIASGRPTGAPAGKVQLGRAAAAPADVASYDVTIRVVDRAGGPPPQFTLQIAGPDYFLQGYGGPGDSVGTYRLPQGHYSVTAEVATATGENTVLAQPDLDVDRPLRVDLDARLGQPLSITVPEPSARQVDAEVSVVSPYGGLTLTGGDGTFDGWYTGRIGPDQDTEGFASVVSGQWAKPDGDGGFTDSPYLYALTYPVRGRMTTGYTRTVAAAELARVHAAFAATGPGTTGATRVRTGVQDLHLGTFGPFLPLSVPSSRIEYHNADPGVASAGDFMETSDDGQGAQAQVQSDVYTPYRAGHDYAETWNRGVFAPAAGTVPGGAAEVYRDGDTIYPYIAPFADGAGRPGDSTTTASDTRLWRNGSPVVRDDSGGFTVAAPVAAYRLEVTAERDAFALSAKVDTVWTFRSARGAAGPADLPLWTMRFTPRLDQHDAAAAGVAVPVPVILTAQPGATTGTSGAPRVEASFDDGITWRPVPVSEGVARVLDPAGSGFVSLRGSMSDSAGNTVTSTVIRAYRFGH